MRLLALLLLLAGTAAAAQPAVTVPAGPSTWQPAAAYVTEGQDEPGYQAWYLARPERRIQVGAFNNYLIQAGVQGVVPTWQLLRTASSWKRCGAEAFEIPPPPSWATLVQTLRYIREHVIPVVGPVEAVSGYRNPALNQCAGGSADSAHRHYSALDLVPLRPTSREALIRGMCAIHHWRGSQYQVGLGFYSFLRFHVDSTRFRKWGADGTPQASPCAAVIAEMEAPDPAATAPLSAAAATAAAPAPTANP